MSLMHLEGQVERGFAREIRMSAENPAGFMAEALHEALLIEIA